MKRRKSAALVGGVAMAASLAMPGSAQAQTPAALACENVANRPHQTIGWVHGTVQRKGAACGNADVVATVYKDQPFALDTLEASNRKFFAAGGMTASGKHAGNGNYYTQIRINGVTKAQSPHTYLQW